MTAEPDVLVLDTHALIWWSLMPERLSKRASKTIDGARLLGVPTIAFWEASLLVRRGRLALSQPIDQWAGRLLNYYCRIPLRAAKSSTLVAAYRQRWAFHGSGRFPCRPRSRCWPTPCKCTRTPRTGSSWLPRWSREPGWSPRTSCFDR